MKIQVGVLAILCLSSSIYSLNNGQGTTPPLGWNSWNAYGCNINEKIIRKAADLLVSTGLADAGYSYINVDDCWQRVRDPTSGNIIADLINFPSGIKALVDYVHSKGLLFGIYSNASAQTCNNRPGSFGNEVNDAKTYASWGVDYIRYDFCNYDSATSQAKFTAMSNAIQATKSPIFIAIDNHGTEGVSKWGGSIANSWRTSSGIQDSWSSFTAALDTLVGTEANAKPGQWNDAGIILAGGSGMTYNEYVSQFALWCALKNPIILGASLDKLDSKILDLLKNSELLDISQDSVGAQAKRYKSTASDGGNLEVWALKVSNNGTVVVLFNRSNSTQNMTFKFKEVGFPVPGGDLYDVITGEDFGFTYTQFSADVPSHSVKVLKLHQMCLAGEKGCDSEQSIEFLGEKEIIA